MTAKVKVTVYLTGDRYRNFTVNVNHVWMTDGFLHVKEGDFTYSYSNVAIEEVIQERLNESS